MRELFLKLEKQKERFNQRREENAETYTMTNHLLLLFFPFFIVAMAEIIQGKYPSKFILFCVERPTVLLFNLLFAALIFGGLLLLVKKGWIAVLTQSVAYTALAIIELFKYGTNGNHLIMTDMRMAKSVKSLTSFAYIKVTPILVVEVLIVFAFFAAVFWFNPKLKQKFTRRIAPAIACLGVCVGVVTIPAISKPVYSFFDLDTSTSDNTFKLNEKFDNNSFLAFFLETASENLANKLVEPENYTEEYINNFLDVDVEQPDGTFVKPNVVVVMSEAFADFRKFDMLDVDDSVYYGFDQLANEGFSATAIVPTFASFTVRTEFELNFGLPMRSLNDPNMPQRLILERAQPTIASYYKDWGYATAYVHPFLHSFYSRSRIYANFDFDTMIFDEDFTVPVEYYGSYIEDKTVFNQINELLNTTDEPMFIHTTTMQNHQPYDQGEDPNAEFDNYQQWIKHTSDALVDFADQLRELDEPTVILMIGDHFPSLKGEDSIYDQMGMNGENCSVLYEQPYLLWSNYDLDCSSMPTEEISTFYLPYAVMNTIDAPRDAYVQAMLNEMQNQPIYATNYSGSEERNETLDIITYDRILGNCYSAGERFRQEDEDE